MHLMQVMGLKTAIETHYVTEYSIKPLNFKSDYLTSVGKYDIFPFVEGGCPLSLMDKTVDS